MPVEVFRAENSDRKHLWCILFPPNKKPFILCVQKARMVQKFLGKSSDDSLLLEDFRGSKLNTNFFFSSFSGTPGISRQNPGKSRRKVWFHWVSRDIRNCLAPTPSRGRPPPHQKISGPKSLSLGSFFLPKVTCLVSNVKCVSYSFGWERSGRSLKGCP